MKKQNIFQTKTAFLYTLNRIYSNWNYLANVVRDRLFLSEVIFNLIEQFTNLIIWATLSLSQQIYSQWQMVIALFQKK